MKTLHDKIKSLPASRRRKIEKRVNELLAEEIMTLRELRKARRMTQVKLAKALGVKQEQVSRIEKRSDMHFSTLRRSVEAMGGSLIVLAEFPDQKPVRLTGFGEL
jgi:DNA-binding XRE family transcriptional regulator